MTMTFCASVNVSNALIALWRFHGRNYARHATAGGRGLATEEPPGFYPANLPVAGMTVSLNGLDVTSSETIANQSLTFGGDPSGGNAAVTNTLTIEAGAVLTLAQDQIEVNPDGSGNNDQITGAGTLVLAAGSTLAINLTAIRGTNPSAGSGAETFTIATSGFENDGTITQLAPSLPVGYAVEMISSPITGVGTIDLGFAFDIMSTVAATQTIDLVPVTNSSGLSDTLRLDAVTSSTPDAVAANIFGLANAGASLDLAKLPYSGSLVPSITNGVLSIIDSNNGNVVAAFNTPDLSPSFHVTLSDNTSGGTNLSVACYCRGTLVTTPDGDRPVESLAVGDLVTTSSGEHRPVRWIGRRSYTRRFLAANPGVQPICFRAGSLGDALPRRDLLVSPDHAMFLDGLLIPAHCLVNGESILQERGLAQVEYLHVELDSHDVILAEGAPSESFYDDDSRGLFHNAAEFACLYPDAKPGDGFCAPRVVHGAALEAVRRRLAEAARDAA